MAGAIDIQPMGINGSFCDRRPLGLLFVKLQLQLCITKSVSQIRKDTLRKPLIIGGGTVVVLLMYDLQERSEEPEATL